MPTTSLASALRRKLMYSALALVPTFTLQAQTAPAPKPATPAATESAQGTDTIKLADFVVTGSNLKRLHSEHVLPVTVISRTEVEARNPATPVELLQGMPQVTASSTNELGNSAINGRGDAASINLRGIGDSNTLILLDGMRMPPRAIIQSQNLPANVNALPSRGLDHIDVLRDGASSIYGSDATAGVINFITKRDYVGTEVTVRGGLTEHGGGQVGEFSVTNGTNFAQGRGNLLSTWSYLNRNAIFFRDRSFTKNDNRSGQAPAPFNIATSPFNTTSAIGFWPTFVIGTATANNYFRPVGSVPTLTTVAPTRLTDPDFYLNIQGDYFSQPRTDRLSLYEKVTYKITDNITAYGDYYFYRATSEVLRSPMFSTNGSEGKVTMSADNPYNPYGSRFYNPTGTPNTDGSARLVGTARTIGITDYTLPDYPVQNTKATSEIYRITAGLRGKFGESWTWNAAAAYGASSIKEQLDRNVYIPAYAAALGRTDATAFNPFGYTFKVQGSAVVIDKKYTNPDSVLRGMEAPFVNRGSADITTLLASGSGELFTLWGHTVSLAVGSEYREESYSVSRDAPSLPTVRTHLTNSALPPSSGKRRVFSAYTETTLPLVLPAQKIPLVHSLEVGASARFEDYSDFGTTTKPKYSANWKPASWMMVRASFNEGFLAPSLPALYQGQTTANTTNIVDVYRNPATSEGQYRSNATTGSNPGLQPEFSKGRSIGIALDVPKVKGLSLTVDYWQIKQSGILGSFNATAINAVDSALLTAETQRQLAAGVAIGSVDLGSGTAAYKGDSRVVRNAVIAADQTAFAAYNSTRPAAQQLAPVGQIFNTRTITENRSEGSASGVDIGLNYFIPNRTFGRFTLSVNAAYLIESYTVADRGGPKIQRLERNGASRWRGDAGVAWRKGQWHAGLTAYYAGPQLDTAAATTAAVWDSLGRPTYIVESFDQGRLNYYFKVGSTIIYNTYVGYSFSKDNAFLKNSKLRATVNNLLDREPPLSTSGLFAGNQQSLLAGRTLSLEWTKEF